MSRTPRPPALAGLHPALAFVLLATCVVAALAFERPAFVAVSLSASVACLVSVRGRAGLRTACALLPLALLVAAVNPLVNTRGATVLFTYASGRRYTLEALAYGAATGFSLMAMLLWFAAFSAVMTSDRLMYLFGRVAPALSTACVLVLRFVPRYGRKASRLSRARAGVGLARASGDRGPRTAALREGAATLGALATWALEDGVDTADSLRARGYGAARRTSYQRVSWRVRDSVYALAAALLLLACIVGAVRGAADVTYLPRIAVPAPNGALWVTLAAYTGFVSLPLVCAGEEALRWRRSRSSR